MDEHPCGGEQRSPGVGKSSWVWWKSFSLRYCFGVFFIIFKLRNNTETTEIGNSSLAFPRRAGCPLANGAAEAPNSKRSQETEEGEGSNASPSQWKNSHHMLLNQQYLAQQGRLEAAQLQGNAAVADTNTQHQPQPLGSFGFPVWGSKRRFWD